MAESESPSPPRGLPRCGTVLIRGEGWGEAEGAEGSRNCRAASAPPSPPELTCPLESSSACRPVARERHEKSRREFSRDPITRREAAALEKTLNCSSPERPGPGSRYDFHETCRRIAAPPRYFSPRKRISISSSNARNDRNGLDVKMRAKFRNVQDIPFSYSGA